MQNFVNSCHRYDDIIVFNIYVPFIQCAEIRCNLIQPLCLEYYIGIHSYQFYSNFFLNVSVGNQYFNLLKFLVKFSYFFAVKRQTYYVSSQELLSGLLAKGECEIDMSRHHCYDIGASCWSTTKY